MPCSFGIGCDIPDDHGGFNLYPPDADKPEDTEVCILVKFRFIRSTKNHGTLQV